MSTSKGDGFELEVEIVAELGLAEGSRPDEVAGLPVAEWLFDPIDVQREEVVLRDLLGAVEELEGHSPPGRPGTGEDA